MKKTKLTQSLIIVALGSILAGGAMAEETLGQKVERIADTTGTKIDNSANKASGYVSDSAITAKVKSALLEDKSITSSDISVETSNGVVTLSGFVGSQELSTRAVQIATQVEGVQSVSDKLQVKDSQSQSVGAYADDAVITSTIKAKLLADNIVPSRKVKVETQAGVVQLSGGVDNKAQSDRAESIAKAVDGVKSVKNDLTVK
ncbi:molecular chaperone OsmY [Pectobacterium quasiaquaticum]|uniref:Osmotically-inducible protein Y n=1 Tax=Pectobacterium quasiaquaticum TaxID=2774015 RepID=A0A9Q2EVS0_9GAMM|nr:MULTISPECIES: molecular chaperone OsmY [Pectobacterium]MBE5203254.1 molecular chaperone OsmY [Pectobacterium quasiaquaticum]MBE5211469.1 molecular chaperone OsmY [Pectobacterium quasiaquaticum]MBE5215690.1 molecular chaperone OsmY [Pectobacterium quasiaquaticum]MBE5221218.1 molecular chaperone OsmY [Pectobacterium quasiaquaticum]MBE5226912.1 molecular chaperone OsmY [Pectobacterium quasiaquaticum]